MRDDVSPSGRDLPADLTDLPSCIPAALQLRESTPDADFVVGSEFRLTFGAADFRSFERAGQLLAAGIGKGSRVGVLFGNDPGWVINWLAATRIGALTVPLSTFSPPVELARVIRHTDVAAILMASNFAGASLVDRLELALPGLVDAGDLIALDQVPFLRWIFVEGKAPAWSRDLSPTVSRSIVESAQSHVHPSDQLVVVSTSGSTAAPKSVVHTHGSLVRHAAILARRRELSATDRIYSPMPFFWVGGLTMVLLAALTSGAGALVQERFDAGEALELVERERATQISCWPNAAQTMAKHPSFDGRDLTSVRGGTLIEALPETHRPPTPDRAPMPLGMTETGGPHTTADDPYLPLPEALRGTLGRSLPGFEHLVVDTDDTPPGVGELLVRGQLMMDAIYKAERHETFTTDGWYPTGDTGTFEPDGYLRFLGRRNSMIKSGGSNVSPAEVEAVLSALPGVLTSHVMGVAAGDRGEDVVAVIVTEPGVTLDRDIVRAEARSALSSFKVPRRWRFVERHELPMLPTGKVDLAVLRNWFA